MERREVMESRFTSTCKGERGRRFNQQKTLEKLCGNKSFEIYNTHTHTHSLSLLVGGFIVEEGSNQCSMIIDNANTANLLQELTFLTFNRGD